MNWLFIGLLLGSTVTSHHTTREACEGRKVLLAEKGATGKCVEISSLVVGITGGSSLIYSNAQGN